MEEGMKKCSRKVRISKLERNAPEIRQWWAKLFQALEAESSIPQDRKIDVLRDIFPEKLFDKIVCMLNIEKFKRVQILEAFDLPPVEETIVRPRIARKMSVESISTASRPPSFRYEDEPEDVEVVYREISASAAVEAELPRKRVGHKNPYTRFFRKPEDKAAIWRIPPPLSLEEMNLTQKAEAITEMIAKEFVDWLGTVMDGEAGLTVENVAKMFEIGFNTHAAHSLCVKMVEMPSVPQPVAEALDMKHLSYRAVLHRLIHQDIRASKRKPVLVAFGRSLPMDLQIRPTKYSIAKKWLYCDKVPKKLETMAAVWEGITHLRSTREYCEYLIENPVVKPPKYLVDSKMLDPAYLRKARASAESEGDIGQIEAADDAPFTGREGGEA